MSTEGPSWEVLLKWSLAHSDGTKPSFILSGEDRKWFMEALQAQNVDVKERMKLLKIVLEIPVADFLAIGATPKHIEGILDEVQDHVVSIDMANELCRIGGLEPLICYLRNSHAIIKAKAAEVVSTIVQNNPESQKFAMEAKVLQPLMDNFNNGSEDDVVRTKALGAISSLIRHNTEGYALFRQRGGYHGLKDALRSKDVRFQRKALNLIHYLLKEKPDYGTIINGGYRRSIMHLASSVDPEVREAALKCLAQYWSGNDQTKGFFTQEEVDELKRVIDERIGGIINMPRSDLEIVKEERQLLDDLWNMFNEGESPICEHNLLVLPGEDDPAPDIASQHFHHPFRAWKDPNTKAKDDSEKSQVLGPWPSTKNAS